MKGLALNHLARVGKKKTCCQESVHDRGAVLGVMPTFPFLNHVSRGRIPKARFISLIVESHEARGDLSYCGGRGFARSLRRPS